VTRGFCKSLNDMYSIINKLKRNKLMCYFLKTRRCAANGTIKFMNLIHEISRNSIITLLCTAKEMYLEQTTLLMQVSSHLF